MATQASAITFIGTTGKAYGDGMRFVQFYFGLPVAMAILAFTLVPLYHRAKVYTAYEYLGQRFDGKTRLLTSVLFLASRGLALGVVVYAPSVVLSLLLGWSLPATVLTMTAVAVAYTMLGGIRAVIWTDVLQMGLIFAGLGFCLAVLVGRLPDGTSLGRALALADVTGHLRTLDWSLDPDDRYTVWSGLLGGTFLFLAYFGCDQSQVQRFLTGRSLRDSRQALLFNAVLKVPMQLFVLFIGVVLFVVFHFEQPPLLFDPVATNELQDTAAAEWTELEERYDDVHAARATAGLEWLRDGGEPDGYVEADAAVQQVRAEAAALARRDADADFDDTNHVFPWFVIHYLPVGVVGLLIAAIFAAAMSSIDSELNALSTASVVDVLRRGMETDERQTVRLSRLLTLGWGVLAAVFALYAGALGSVIEAVNVVGSYFYGSLLGVFVLAFATRRANGHGAFWGLLAGMAAVFVASRQDLAWLWLNPIGCLTVVAVGLVVSAATASRAPA
jgi:Na+/proline symporter